MKDNITKLKIFILLLTIIGLGSGCNENQNQMGYNNKDLSISQVHTSKPIDQSVANQAKEKMITKDEITDVRAVNTDKELLVAIKVENFNRFRLKSIEKTVKSDLEKMYPNHKVVVSTDKKMFWELEKIEQRLQKNNMNKKSLKKDLQKLESILKEQT
ncbi:YhcN/YlaJ family sporulation lipoprotein [Robertmurraya korlensis]|uniref:YhcN/YlaJ family sporulation lipoprotein n=1 Tax=Robertmurraya korlensis TaxID=519977 RepID=UPI00203A971F|nr:YhcN/YlaJ family sporulation lipoprotein [Robertmurraya korlensis]MCM3603179.1 YhcN/YlaJ family sporulation lipoprotein [Robertmurraya korlensis]